MRLVGEAGEDILDSNGLASSGIVFAMKVGCERVGERTIRWPFHVRPLDRKSVV